MSEDKPQYGQCCDSCYWYEPRGEGATWGLCLASDAFRGIKAQDQCVLATDGAQCPAWRSLAQAVQGCAALKGP